jgi:hypothetical protein
LNNDEKNARISILAILLASLIITSGSKKKKKTEAELDILWDFLGSEAGNKKALV